MDDFQVVKAKLVFIHNPIEEELQIAKGNNKIVICRLPLHPTEDFLKELNIMGAKYKNLMIIPQDEASSKMPEKMFEAGVISNIARTGLSAIEKILGEAYDS